MRKIIPLVAVLLLGGCATMPGSGGGGGSIAAQIAQAQAIAQQVCKFLPTVATVAGLFNAGLGSAFEVANAICAAVVPQPGARTARRGTPVVRGVPIRGQFVR
jgi:hypothetical protein